MCHKQLPAGYVLHETIDLQKNKRQFWSVNLLSIVLAVLLAGAGILIAPFSGFSSQFSDEGYLLLQVLPACITALLGAAVYLIAHELTHGMFLYAFTRVKPKFGFVGWAAYCGNGAYCDKPRYAVVALSPLVIWGVIFGVLNVFFHEGIWFWAIWLLQIVNIAGASGDLFVFFKLLRYPQNILVGDTGLKMCVYVPATTEDVTKAADNMSEKGDNV